jgi:hypothetical protein
MAVVYAVVSGVAVGRRTEIQLALLVIGLVVWAIGLRTEIVAVQWTGIGFFAAATALRFLKKKEK